MTTRKIYIIFAMMSFCFCRFCLADYTGGDYPYGICDVNGCLQLKAAISESHDMWKANYRDSASYAGSLRYQAQNFVSQGVSGATTLQNTVDSLENALSTMSVYESALTVAVGNIDCYACSNVSSSSVCYDLTIVTNIYNSLNVGLSQVAGSLTNIVSFLGSFDGDHGNSLAEALDYLNVTLDSLYDNLPMMSQPLISSGDYQQYVSVNDPWIQFYVENIYSNIVNGVSSDFSFTNRLNHSSLLGWDRFQSYLQAQRADQTVSWYPVSPYNSQWNLQNATIYDALAAGFENTLISLGSLNNYFYWIKNHMPSNSYDDTKILASIGALSNTLNRIDDYVVQDFSNEFYKLSQYLITNSFSSSSSSVDSNYYHSVTGSLLTIRDLLDTNNLYLASIESSVTNIDFSVGRFRDYLLGSQNSISDYDDSEDSSYYDFLTNKYIVGTSDDGVSSNWFERIETLLAALVFSTDSKTNIVSSGSFDNVSESDVRGTLEDVSFNGEFSDMVDSVGDVQQSFIEILNSLHSSVKNVVNPQSISIGLTDTGTTTADFDSLLGGKFEVSVSSGEFDSFTEVVRAVTTMIIVLVTLIMIYKTCFFLIRNAYKLYSFGRTLVTSIFFR